MSLQARKIYHGDSPINRDRYQATADQDQRPITVVNYDTNKVLARFRPVYRILDDIVKRNGVTGGKWFDPSSMRFFGCRLLSPIYPLKDGRALFVTSERDRYPGGAWNGQRRYTLRGALANGEIQTVGEFGEYDTARQAHAAARKLAIYGLALGLLGKAARKLTRVV